MNDCITVPKLTNRDIRCNTFVTHIVSSFQRKKLYPLLVNLKNLYLLECRFVLNLEKLT